MVMEASESLGCVSFMRIFCVVNLLVVNVVSYGRHQREFDDFGYIEYQTGSPESNILLTIPHGGSLIPDSLPDRQPGCFISNNNSLSYKAGSSLTPHHNLEKSQTTTTGKCLWRLHCGSLDLHRCAVIKTRSSYALDLGNQLTASLSKLIGETPHLLINHLHRNKMDPDRPRDEGTLGIPHTEQAWNNYQNFITRFKSSVFNVGLVVNLDTHMHSSRRIEIGYNIPAVDLNTNNFTAQQTSLRALSGRTITIGAAVRDIVMGDSSLGLYLHMAGYDAVPSPQRPSPRTDSYDSGGYVIDAHGSRDGGLVDAVQISVPEAELDTPLKSERVTRAVAASVAKFMLRHHYISGVPIDVIDSHFNIVEYNSAVRYSIGPGQQYCAIMLMAISVLRIIL